MLFRGISAELTQDLQRVGLPVNAVARSSVNRALGLGPGFGFRVYRVLGL